MEKLNLNIINEIILMNRFNIEYCILKHKDNINYQLEYGLT